MIILDLPVVVLPRVNNRYNKNFSLKKEYRIGKANLVSHIVNQTRGCEIIKPPYSVTINVGTHFDIDSSCKPLLDSMQEAGVIDNDKNIWHMVVDKTAVKRNEDNWIIVELEHYRGKGK